MKNRWWVLGFAIWTLAIAAAVWLYRDARGAEWRERARVAIADSTARVVADSLGELADSTAARSQLEASARIRTIDSVTALAAQLRARSLAGGRVVDSLGRVLELATAAADSLPIYGEIVEAQGAQIMALEEVDQVQRVALQDARSTVSELRGDIAGIRLLQADAMARLRADNDSLRAILTAGLGHPAPGRGGVLGLLQDLGRLIGAEVGPGYVITTGGERVLAFGVFRPL